MKRALHAMMLAAVLAGTASGCQSFSNSTVRGQSPMNPDLPMMQQQNIQQIGHHQPIRAAANGFRESYQGHHNTSVQYFPNQHAGAQQGYGDCPPNGYDQCPPGQYGHRHDKFSYGYRVPNDLVYPAENSVGGAVMYPYYTHRGPSDFFRK